MEHILGVAGSALGIVGTAALSFDLWHTKVGEEAFAKFKQAQDQLDASFQDLIVSVNGNVSTLAEFTAKYLRLLELDMPGGPQADPAVVREVRELRATILTAFIERVERKKGTGETEVARALIEKSRLEIAERFRAQVESANRMRRIAAWGVVLVGIGAVAALLDLMVAP